MRIQVRETTNGGGYDLSINDVMVKECYDLEELLEQAVSLAATSDDRTFELELPSQTVTLRLE